MTKAASGYQVITVADDCSDHQSVGWRKVAKAIGELGIGLDDDEYVGGVLWYGLTHRGAEGNPEEQKRVITDRLVRWASPDGGDASRAAAAIRPVLDTWPIGTRAGRASPGLWSAVRGPETIRPAFRAVR